MSNIKKYKIKDIFTSLKQNVIGRISESDLKLLKKRFVDFEKHRCKPITFYKGYAKIIYYQLNKQEDNSQNKQWIRIKNKLEQELPFIIGTTEDTYLNHGKSVNYYKYFRYYDKYKILELVSDYYNKIPIFFHLSSTGIYEIVNDIECIEGIDNIPKFY